MNIRISILGCGRIGLPLASLLLKHNFQVKGSTTNASKIDTLKQAGIQTYLLDICKRETAVLDEFLQTDIAIITLPPSSSKDSPHEYSDQLQFIAEGIERAGVKKVLFTGSTDVYPQNGKWMSEQDAVMIKPRFTPIPALSIERLLTENSAFKTTILRFAGLMGPSYGQQTAYYSGRDIKGADDLINMIHQDDCVAIIYKIIQRDIWGETFNLTADSHPTKRQYYDWQCDLRRLPRANFIEGESAFRLVSNKHVKQTLDYQFIYPDPLLALV